MTITKIYTHFYRSCCSLENVGFDFSYTSYPAFENENGKIGLEIISKKGRSFEIMCFVIIDGQKNSIDVKQEFQKISHRKFCSFFYQLKYVIQHQMVYQQKIFGITISRKLKSYSYKWFIHNINYALQFGWEPEISLINKNGKRSFLVAYETYIDFFDEDDVHWKLTHIDSIVNYVQFEDIVAIEGNAIDFSYPIEYQSIVVDGIMWMNGGRRINRYQNELNYFKNKWKWEERKNKHR